MKKAIIFGATGFVGSYLIKELLASNNYSQVIAVTRKPLKIDSGKLKNIIADHRTLAQHRADLIADDVFITLGTTKANTPDRKSYYQVEHDLPVLASQLCKENGATTVCLLTAVSDGLNSPIFYVRTKAETERDVTALNYNRTYIFKPSVILGNRIEDRPLEKILIAVWKHMNFALPGPLRKLRGIKAEEIAKAMYQAAQQGIEKFKKFHWDEMQALNK
jgi:uncharacterized protein YbjT (DUF2867 family)